MSSVMSSINEPVFEIALAALREKLSTCKLAASTSSFVENDGKENKNDTKTDLCFLELQKETEKHHKLDDMISGLSPIKSTETVTKADKMEQNGRTVLVDNLHEASTSEELEAFFEDCGPIERINLVSNTLTDKLDGFAYITFIDQEGFEKALELNKSNFLGKIITVEPKGSKSKNFGKSPRFLTRYRSHIQKTRGRKSRAPY